MKSPRRLSVPDFDALLRKLGETHRLIGPTLRDGAICFGPIGCVADLPGGWTEIQEKGHYRLQRREDEALFGYTVGPHSLKNYLHLPRERLFRAKRTSEGFEVEAEAHAEKDFAFVGPRGCDLAAMAIQDRVFLHDAFRDTRYASRREGAFVLAIQCTTSAPTCFCPSMETGPAIGEDSAADLIVTEVLADGHHFLCTSVTERGEDAIVGLGTVASTDEDKQAQALVAANEEHIRKHSRRLDPDASMRLGDQHDHPRWEQVAQRCLNCANCTMVCPTCFCSTVEDVTDLGGDIAERWRRWDSCFNMEFSYIHGGEIRTSGKSRYRQWMTHKLSSWHEQFGTSGCVGCGRCVTWCPVGIDITEEAHEMARSEEGP